jgi:hypothetical protein
LELVISHITVCSCVQGNQILMLTQYLQWYSILFHTPCPSEVNLQHRAALHENLMIIQQVNKFPAFYRTRSFITVFTRVRHWSLPTAKWITFNPILLFKILINMIVPSMPRYPVWSLLFSFSHRNPLRTSQISHSFHTPHPSRPPLSDHSNILFSILFSNILNILVRSSPMKKEQFLHQYKATGKIIMWDFDLYLFR